jgi:phage/plasmid primase-like uncharacterized protein
MRVKLAAAVLMVSATLLPVASFADHPDKEVREEQRQQDKEFREWLKAQGKEEKDWAKASKKERKEYEKYLKKTRKHDTPDGR